MFKYGLAYLGLMLLPLGAAFAQDTCNTTVTCAQVAVRVAGQAKTDVAAATNRTEAKIAEQAAELAKIRSELTQLQSAYANQFKGQAALPNCSYSISYGNNPSTLPPNPPNQAKGVAWCPPHTYVAGSVNYAGQAQDQGVICCPAGS